MYIYIYIYIYIYTYLNTYIFLGGVILIFSVCELVSELLCGKFFAAVLVILLPIR